MYFEKRYSFLSILFMSFCLFGKVMKSFRILFLKLRVFIKF